MRQAAEDLHCFRLTGMVWLQNPRKSGAPLKQGKDPCLLAVIFMAKRQKLQGKDKSIVAQPRPLAGQVMDFLLIDKQDRAGAGKENLPINHYPDGAF